MSIETLLPLPEALALPAAPAATATSPVAAATTSAATRAAPGLQERRLRAARELDNRIRRLEQETVRLASCLDATRRNTREHLAELQQRSSSLTTEVLRAGARLARQGRDQDEQRRQLDQRLGERLRELEAALAPVGDTLQHLAGQMQELQSRHDTLSRLHEHLERIVSRQGRGLDIVAAEFEQRVELLRVSLEGVQALFREQQESQVRMAVEQQAIAVMAQALQSRLDDIRADVQRQHEDTRRRVRMLTSLLVAFALGGLGLLAWCQFHPVTLPASARQQLAALAAGLATQQAHGRQLDLAMSRQASQLQSLQHELEQLRQDQQRLQAENRRQRARLSRLSRLSTRMVAAPASPAATPPAGPAATTTHSPAATPGPDSGAAPLATHDGTALPLPAAVTGLRQDI